MVQPATPADPGRTAKEFPKLPNVSRWHRPSGSCLPFIDWACSTSYTMKLEIDFPRKVLNYGWTRAIKHPWCKTLYIPMVPHQTSIDGLQFGLVTGYGSLISLSLSENTRQRQVIITVLVAAKENILYLSRLPFRRSRVVADDQIAACHCTGNVVLSAVHCAFFFAEL